MSHHHSHSHAPAPACASCSSCGCSHEQTSSRPAWLKLALAGILFFGALILPLSGIVKLAVYLAAYVICGGEIVLKSVRNLMRGEVFDENFLMTVATLGAFLIGEYPEGVAVMLFYQTGELLQGYAAGKSRRSIVKLMDLRPDFARVVRDGQERTVPPQDVQEGEMTVVRPGERIPLDGIIEEGTGHLDASALTGESRPVEAQKGKEVLAGYISIDGALKIRALKTYQNSAVAKILELAENAANKKSQAEKFITRFARVYTPIVVILAVLVAVIPPLLIQDALWKTWIYRALIFLVISCPCALVLSVPLGFFGGIGGAARNGILIKGSSYLELLSRLYTVAFDKTGTLTQGVFKVTAVRPISGVTRQELLELTAVAEGQSNHPIARAVLKAAKEEDLLKTAAVSVRELAGEGVEAVTANGRILAGNARLMRRFNIIPPEDGRGTCVYIAQNGVYKGLLELGDQLKPGAKEAVRELQNGLVRRVAVLSGDNVAAVEKTAQELGITDVYGGLLPAGKVETLEKLMSQTPDGMATAFVGDGINDAPVLARADLGIAMGALGSDAAIEAADIVLMTDEPKKIASAVRISRKTLTVIKQNIVFALTVKAAVLVLGVAGFANMWSAVFADVGVSLLAVANSLRPLYFKD